MDMNLDLERDSYERVIAGQTRTVIGKAGPAVGSERDREIVEEMEMEMGIKPPRNRVLVRQDMVSYSVFHVMLCCARV